METATIAGGTRYTSEARQFYPAEEKHKDFYEKNKNPFYCRIVIDPKIQKLYRDFKELA